VGAYLVAGLAATALGLSGGFGRVLALVPAPVVSGMLAGILVKFGLGLFKALGERTLLVGAMVLAFLLLRRFAFRAPTVGALLAGLAVAFARHEVHFGEVQLALAVPVWTWPAFSLGAILGLGLPLFVLAMVSQNAPGIAIVRAAGYDAPIDVPTTVTGILSLLTAPFGGHGINLAVLTAAIVTGPEAHPDPDRRYAAGVATGCWYLLTGLFGATAVGIFAGLPKDLIAAVAGLALLGATATALTGAMREPAEREGALIAFLVTAADLTFLGIGAPFWGLLLGALAQRALTWRRGQERPRPTTGNDAGVNVK
jgi:benzoate membrane transport protein